MDIKGIVEIRGHRSVRVDEVVCEKPDDDGGVCGAVVFGECGSSGFGWIAHISMRETEELASYEVGDEIPASHMADCADRGNHAPRKPENSKIRVSRRFQH